MPKRYIIYALLIGLAAGAVLERKYAPPKVETKHSKEVVTIIKRPDGTKETTITKDIDLLTPIGSTGSASTWNISLGAGLYNLKEPYYLIQANKRVIGPLTVGAWASTKQDIGITLGVIW